MLEYFLPRASSFAGSIDQLFDIITYLVMFWFTLTLAFFLYVVFRFRHKPGQKAQYITGETHRQKMAVEVPHYLILLCDLVILGYTFVVWHEVKIDMPEPDAEVRVVSQQWAWTFYHAGMDGELGTEDDIATINELHLKKDAQYTYHLESLDVMHSFSIPVFRLKQDAVPGRIIRGHFQPILEGEWDIQCAEMCGYGHGFMPARVIISSAEEYDAWVAENTPDHLKPDTAYAQNESEKKEASNNG
ncbi:cytochrome c oxidase subunit II [Pelagicoccus albus]|uniref:cytochrome-c oxidase n=1 Tax=Pelagicoccus albus TaxID=415222 RepID=A0A7X1B3U7_9BACT|nr:cytochrome c oxidase subunit II [Pelagicoccus albus]MBC2605141.1 cytochrome c oxidase subunit II [Pelagicoccus albus]